MLDSRIKLTAQRDREKEKEKEKEEEKKTVVWPALHNAKSA